MCEEVNIIQKAALGSETTQVAVQNNYNGLSVQDATQMAFSIFHNYYPLLQKEALEEVKRLVEEKLNAFPPEDIIAPKARVAVTTLQHASITDEHEIRSMFATLLANSMNRLEESNVHPSFAEIVKQLSADEANILKHIYGARSVPIINIRLENTDGGYLLFEKNFSDIGYTTNCKFPLKIASYFDNLIRLGLCEIPDGIAYKNEKHYEQLKNHPYILSNMELAEQYGKRLFESNPASGERVPKHNRGVLRMTDFGDAFCRVCLS